jgi:hypothetical protein
MAHQVSGAHAHAQDLNFLNSLHAERSFSGTGTGDLIGT